MNANDLQELPPADRAFASRLRLRLRASESLNYVESARLAATRAQARELVATPHRLPAWGWLATPALLAAVTFSILHLNPAVSPQIPAPNATVLMELSADVNASSGPALIWVSDEAGPDFYRDLEFYEWLQSRPRMEPNA